MFVKTLPAGLSIHFLYYITLFFFLQFHFSLPPVPGGELLSGVVYFFFPFLLAFSSFTALTTTFSGDIVSASKMAVMGTAPCTVPQRGDAAGWKRLRHAGRAIPPLSRPPNPSGLGWAGSSRYRGHERLDVTFRLLAARGFPPTRAGVRALRPSPRPRFGPSARLATA